MRESYYVIEFSNGTFYSGDRYSTNTIEKAKKYIDSHEALKEKEGLEGEWTDNLNVIKIEISRTEEKASFKDIKNDLLDMQNLGYKEFVKALISIEQNINDEEILDNIYDQFMNLDDMGLINDSFIDILEDIKNEEAYQKNKFKNIELIDKDKALEILNSSSFGINSKYEPLGSFYYVDNNAYVAIDNTGGNAFVEVFDNLNDCVDWLNHKFEISDFLEEGKAKINKRTLEDGWDLEL